MKEHWENRFEYYKRLSHTKTHATNNVYAWYDALRQCLGEYARPNRFTSSLSVIDRLRHGQINVNGGTQIAELLKKEINRWSIAGEWIDRSDDSAAIVEILAADVADALGDEALDPKSGLYAILKVAEEKTGKSLLYKFKILGANTNASSSSMQND